MASLSKGRSQQASWWCVRSWDYYMSAGPLSYRLNKHPLQCVRRLPGQTNSSTPVKSWHALQHTVTFHWSSGVFKCDIFKRISYVKVSRLTLCGKLPGHYSQLNLLRKTGWSINMRVIERLPMAPLLKRY